MMISIHEKYDDLVESVSVWYEFFREKGTDPGPATSRVLNQLHFLTSANEDLLLVAYLLLIEEVLLEQHPDEETVTYLFDALFEDFQKENLKAIVRKIASLLTEEQQEDLISHLESIHTSLLLLQSPSLASFSEELMLVG